MTKGIVHRDLHSGNILIHQGVIKLADFGYQKGLKQQIIRPKERKNDNTSQQYKLNEKSDIYSVGVLLWEQSNGSPPFHVKDEMYDISLAIEIAQGLRERVYYWDNEPDNRQSINKVD
ncbi:15024_t:CDS:2 [Funneliformis geosporum]|nr:15024_t:CDS:2 [Funneliformis geosporum]